VKLESQLLARRQLSKEMIHIIMDALLPFLTDIAAFYALVTFP